MGKTKAPQEYPKVLHHPDGSDPIDVHSAEEEKQLRAIGYCSWAQFVSHRDHLTRLDRVREQHPDFLVVAQRAVEEVGDIPGPMAEVIRGLENSGEVTYALISKPSTLRRIAEMPVVQAITEIAKISAGLMGAKSDPPTSRAPAPVTPVKKSGPGHAPSIYDEDLPYEEYVKLRNKQNGRSG